MALSSPLASSQHLDRGAEFEGNIEIDAMHAVDGSNRRLAASGEAGEYGRAYLTYTFTNKLSLNQIGEFTGYAWTQSGAEVVTAS